jgi:hypothetical protein
VPANQFGTQQAASDSAYMGAYTYSGSPSLSYKEYVATTITAMQVGAIYEVSLSVSLADNSRYATDDMGAYFYLNGSSTVSGSGVLTVTPQVFFTLGTTIKDKINWVRLSKTFIADSAYTNIVIGGFKNYTAMTRDSVGGTQNYSYYYIDSIVVRVADTIHIDYTDTLLCAGDTISVPYLANALLFNSGNIFKLQLSDASGSFSSPVVIGSITGTGPGTIQAIIPSSIIPGTGYRLRIISTNPAFTSPVSIKNILISKTIPGKPVASSNTPICEGDSLKLFATDTSAAVNYSWTGPSNYFSGIQNPTIFNAGVSASGAYIVSAYIAGCRRKDTVNVTVKPMPAKPFTASTNAPCDNDTLKLSTNSVLAGSTFVWTGPNSFSANTQSPKIGNPPLSTAGKYYVTASLNGCSAKDSVTVSIKQAPQSPITTSNSPLCERDTLKLTSLSSTPGVSYSWAGPNSFTSTTQNPTLPNIPVTSTGDYIVTALFNGCAAKDTAHVLVNAYPANVNISSNSPVCATDSIKLNTSSTTTGITHSWTGPASFAATISNPFRLNAVSFYAGDYIDTLNNNGCKVIDTVTVVVKPLPGVPGSGNNSPLCTGATLYLNVSSATGVSYSWTGPNNFISTTQNPIRLYITTADSGDYVAIANLNGCIKKDSTHVVVYPVTPKPTANANNPICLGAALFLSANTIPNAIYNWTGPNNFFSTQQNNKKSNITAADAGKYFVTAKLHGCVSAPDSVTITTIQGPAVSIYASPKDSICAGANAALVSIPFGIGPQGATYQWYKNGNTAGVTTGNYIVPNANNGDKFFVEMQAIASVCNSPVQSNAVTLTVLPATPAPAASIAAYPGTDMWPYLNVSFSISNLTNGGSNPAYQWMLNGKNVSSATANKWNSTTLKDGDSVCLLVTSSDQCATPKSALSNCLKMKIPAGVGPLNPLRGDLAVYPNPNRGDFYFTHPYTPLKRGSFVVTDVTGRIIAVYSITEQKTLIQLPKGISAGVYVGKLIDTDGNISVARIVVE